MYMKIFKDTRLTVAETYESEFLKNEKKSMTETKYPSYNKISIIEANLN